MALRKLSIFTQSRLFQPAIIRQMANNSSYIPETSAAALSGSNLSSTSSFRYDPIGSGVKSSQQLPIDFSKFENHAFFDSAESKVNVAFDSIINGYPFDGNQKEIEIFDDKLTGFEKYVFNSFPKNMGYLFFSGADGVALSVEGSFIKVDDYAGSLYPTLSKNRSGENILDPLLKSITFEMDLFVPAIINDNQVILQKLSGSTNGITLALSESADTSECALVMFASSGSLHLSASTTFTKGAFQHVCATFNRLPNDNKLQLFINSSLAAQSSGSAYFGDIAFNASPMYIGSGSAHITGTLVSEQLGLIPVQTLSGAIDELRVFHSVRTQDQQAANRYQNVYPQSDLKLYFKFNEPSGSYATRAVCLDSSGNSLHSIITNYDNALRTTGSQSRDGAGLVAPNRPLTLERQSRNPVLFPDQASVVNLNVNLLTSASQYDRNNPNMITKLIPKHYLMDAAQSEGFGLNMSGNVGSTYSAPLVSFPGGGKIGSPQIVSMFLFTWAKYFDELKVFIDHVSNLLHPTYDQYETVAAQFLPFLSSYYGFELPNQFANSSIDQYLEGENLGIDRGLSTYGLQHIQNELWKRILKNLPEVIRSKGTIHSIKAFMRAGGINPNRNFRFREFGGIRHRRVDNIDRRLNFTEIAALLDMSGTLAGSPAVDSLGIPTSRPFIMSPFLSGARLEVGTPTPSTAQAGGAFVEANTPAYGVHGIYNRRADGLFTSGSWTFEGIYKFMPTVGTGSKPHFVTQSLGRLHITGTSAPSTTHAVIVNMLAYSGSGLYTSSLRLYARPGLDANSPTFVLNLTGVNIFDGDKWHVAFGRARNDIVDSSVSSSYFIVAGKQNWGRLAEYHYTSSYFLASTGTNAAADNMFQSSSYTNNSFNTSGSFLAFGSQSLAGTSTDFFLNSVAKTTNDASRTTHFSGRMGHIRFWSLALSGSEIKEHIRNFKSVGVRNPLVNFNFETSPSGSFERLRIDVSSDQLVTQSNTLGNITLFDFTQQFVSGARGPGGDGAAVPWLPQTSYDKTYYHFSGSGFETSKEVVKPERFDYSIITPKFDEASCDNKVRIRGFQQYSNVTEFGGAVAPVYEIERSETPTDDTRFAIETSCVQALNEDIVNIFSSLEKLDSAIGNPELIFAQGYGGLADLRNVYFNRLTEKINYTSFFEFFKWFTTAYENIIEGLIPRRTKFMGMDFVIESHMLERAKIKYNYEDVYLGENIRHGLRGQILLQQLVANFQRM